ncbi:MAG: hypothetical protein ACREM8_09995 [Vulcanimicrobiaceae bacterium]
MAEHRHRTPLRGTAAIPRPARGRSDYTEVNYRYAGQVGHIHEVVEIAGKSLAKVGFDDRKIVYYLLEDLEMDEAARKRTFHDDDPSGGGSERP